MKRDYKGNVDTGIGSLFKEVGKEIVHQVNGHNFVEDKAKSVLEETTKAYGDAIASAIEQQEALDKEMADFDNTISESVDNDCFHDFIYFDGDAYNSSTENQEF